MYAGQQIVFDEQHHSGVYKRVHDKLSAVTAIYANPDRYDSDSPEHHTAVALRELALEEVRRQCHPMCPSRMSCLYVSETLTEAEQWAAYFSDIGRPAYQIVYLKIEGSSFVGDAAKCFRGQTDQAANIRLAKRYWKNALEASSVPPVREILVDGCITVLKIVKEINANITP